jgi:leucyl/phenylalanyl-tRNA--protein transferase
VSRHIAVTPELVLKAYAAGYFPMAESRTRGDVLWVEPEMRGIIPLEGLHISKSLRRTVARDVFTVTADEAFSDVVAACAAPGPDREDTWINPEIEAIYNDLHQLGFAHSVTCWSRDGALAGGLFGVRLGAAFFGESMFSWRSDASKVALVHLVARLRRGGFTLLDTQFITDHLKRLGAIEVSKGEYRSRLSRALQSQGLWDVLPPSVSGRVALQDIGHTS